MLTTNQHFYIMVSKGGQIEMTDTKKLKAILILKGLTLSDLSKAIGISKQSLSMKINNVRDFKAKEIKAISDYLELDSEQTNGIFFKHDVD